MSRAVAVVIGAALCAAAAFPAAAQDDSRRRGSVQVIGETYRPNVDADLSTHPYQDAFGTRRGWMFRGLASRALYVGVGALEAGVGGGYFQDRGHGVLSDGTKAAASTTFHVLPVTLSLTYRFDYLEQRWRIPFMFYGRASLERFHWWVSDGNGDRSESGATNGYSFTGGAGLLLDFFDRGTARELDRETGINDTWLTFDVTKSYVDDFGSSKSWDLSDEKLSLGIGLLFAF